MQHLQQRGIREVHVLSQSQFEESVSSAVYRTLREELSGLEIPPVLLDKLRERAQAMFARIAQPSNALAPSGVARDSSERRRHAGSGLDELVRLAGGPSEGSGPGSTGDAHASLETLESKVTRHLGTVLAEDLARKVEQVERGQREQVEILEQRISKLARALESADRVLAGLQRTDSVERSSMRGVPTSDSAAGAGLESSSPLFERKSELLTALFQANLALQDLKRREANA